VAAVDSVAAVAVPVESAIAGKRLTLIKTLTGLSGPGGPEFLQKTG
jgi:hypothetical protein